MQIRKKIPKGQFIIPNCKYVIIDTDAGGDDTQALIYAFSEAKKHNKTIIGITCIDGNTSRENVVKNCLIATGVADVKIPIFKGSSTNLTCWKFKDAYFGSDGFGLKQEEYIKKLKAENKWNEELIQQQNAIQFLIQSASKYAGDLAIIAIGPLTNLALAYHLDNSFPSKVPFLSIMGGSISNFGIRQFFAAEFNFHLDAHAAKIVFEVFPCVCISSFDLSFDLGTQKTLDLFTDDSTPKSKLIHDIHGQILKTHRPSVCDPLAIIPVFNPEIVESVYKAYGTIQINGVRTRGTLVFDWFSDEIKGKQKIWAIADINLDQLIKEISSSYK